MADCACTTNKTLTFNIHIKMIDLYLKRHEFIQCFNV